MKKRRNTGIGPEIVQNPGGQEVVPDPNILGLDRGDPDPGQEDEGDRLTTGLVRGKKKEIRVGNGKKLVL